MSQPVHTMRRNRDLVGASNRREAESEVYNFNLDKHAVAQIKAMLAADTDNLTKHDIASAATWADKFCDVNHRQDNYTYIQNWHFVDMEISNPDLNSACFGRPQLPAREPAGGPDQVCAVDKIAQFAAELSPAIPTLRNELWLSNSFSTTSAMVRTAGLFLFSSAELGP
jgi:S1/P1 Nuclease